MKRLLAWIVLAGVAWPASGDDLTGLIRQRLSLMDEVAAWKWHNAQPVEDSAREARVLEEATAAALSHGLEVETTRSFFRTQIDAARDIQQYWFRYWKKHPPPESGPDLLTQIRPELLRLGAEILRSLAASRIPDGSSFQQALLMPGLGERRIEELYSRLQAIHRYENLLEQVMQSGVLRVGTTGDYAPFSFRTGETGEYTGIDIEMASDLAHSLGARLRLVSTSWPDLVSDLTARRYDIAMSGVSRTLERQRVGYFSQAYHEGGKTPVSRCELTGRFDSLEKIDHPGVRVIVNPGGTNERFVRSRIHRAQIVLHPDNRTIFEQLVSGRADVMITDRIEVQLQTRRHTELCAAMPGENLTFQEKGYLMQRDEPFREFVNLWLQTRIRDGTVRALFDQFLE